MTRPTTRSSPLTPPPAWADQAACTAGGVDPEVFFPPDFERAGEDRAGREAAAKAVCSACPVRTDCLTYAVDTRQAHGVWGGLTETERRDLTALVAPGDGSPR